MRRLLILWAFCLGLFPALAAARYQPIDRVVAVVNDDVITQQELDRRIDVLAAKLAQRGARPPRPALEHQVLERLIDERLQLQAARRLGIQVEDSTLARAIGSIARKNGLTLDELRQVLADGGISFARFRERTRRQILFSRLRAQEVVNRIKVSDQEIRHFIESRTGLKSQRSQVHLRHILVSLPEDASPEEIQKAEAKAKGLLKRLRAGADFSEVALLHSDGRHALEGGDLGWIKISEVPSIAEGPANRLEKGGISDLIRTSSGFHIFQLVDYKGLERAIVTQTHARHILIRTNDLISDRDARTRLEQLRFRILSGEDFGTLARSHSDDTASAVKGGDLGWVSPGDTVPEFERQMDRLSEGEISEPFKTPFGWHIVQVLGRRDYDNTEELLKSRAREAIRTRKAKEATDLWLRRLRAEAYVEVRLDENDG